MGVLQTQGCPSVSPAIQTMTFGTDASKYEENIARVSQKTRPLSRVHSRGGCPISHYSGDNTLMGMSPAGFCPHGAGAVLQCRGHTELSPSEPGALPTPAVSPETSFGPVFV